MNRSENLLVVAQEECAEIQQEISKALRFGVKNYHPDTPNITNEEKIMKEFVQLNAVMDMLIMNKVICGITESEQSEIYREKINNVEKWMKYSQSIGMIQ